MKEGIFVGPQIREVVKDTEFEELLTLKELRAWEAFKAVCNGFLGRHRAGDYEERIKRLLQRYKDMGCRMSLPEDSLPSLPPRLLSSKPWSSQ